MLSCVAFLVQYVFYVLELTNFIKKFSFVIIIAVSVCLCFLMKQILSTFGTIRNQEIRVPGGSKEP